jgi:hypothetical protein
VLRNHPGTLHLKPGAWLDAVGRALLTFWIGSLWTIGYLAAPALFALLDRPLAGRVAGELFRLELWVTLACAPPFVLCELAHRRSGVRLAAPALILGAQLVIEVFLRPRIAASVPGGGAFAWLHGSAAMLYLSASLAGLWLVLARPRTALP